MIQLSNSLAANYALDRETGCWRPPDSSSFGYSDGDAVEERLLAIVRQAQDLSSTSSELMQHAVDWPTRYHLHPRRSNLLRPIRHLLCGEVLEIGAGCGALTRFLGENGASVTAIEGSFRRASVAAGRCRDLPNVTVLAESFDRFHDDANYDVVLLIGVLEYSRKFLRNSEGDPVDAMLRRARSFLKPNGILVVAIENQLGLKYFVGYPEDHTGELGGGIEDRYETNGVVTFGRRELGRKISNAGFSKMDWWYPFPDYKLPLSVISERALAHDLDLLPWVSNAFAADLQEAQVPLFSPEQILRPVLRNGLLPDLANSFLVVASNRGFASDTGEPLGYQYAVERRPEFAKEVRLEKEGGRIVAKSRRLYPELKDREDAPLVLWLHDEPAVNGTQWNLELNRIVNKPGWELTAVQAWARVWFDALQKSAPALCAAQPITARTLLGAELFEAVPTKLLITPEGEVHWIGQEWKVRTPVELGYLLVRGIVPALLGIRSCASPSPGSALGLEDLVLAISNYLGVPLNEEDLARYVTRECEFNQWIGDSSMQYSPDDLHGLRLPARPNLKESSNHADAIRKREGMRSQEGRAEHQLSELRETQAETLAALAKTAGELEELRISHEQVAEELRTKSAIVNQIYASYGWKALAFYYRIRHKLFAPGKSGFPYRQLRHIRRGILLIREKRYIARSGLFDRTWYLQQNPDVAAARVDPLRHYLLRGANEGRDPNPFFDSDWYLEQNPDVAGASANPLVHFLRFGGLEGRDPSPRFDSAWYLRQNPDVEGSRQNPLSHFLRHGITEGRSPRPFRPGSLVSQKAEPDRVRSVRQAGAWPRRAFGGAERGRSQPKKIVLASCALPAGHQSAGASRRDYRYRFVCVTHVLPYPARAGNEYRIHRMLTWLDAHGFEVFLVICPLPDQTVSVEQLESLSSAYSNVIVCLRDGTLFYHLAEGDGAVRGLAGRVPGDFAGRLGEDAAGSNIGAHLLPILRTFCPDLLLEVLAHLDASLQPDIFQLEYVFMTRALPLLRSEVVKVVDTHDVFSTKCDKVARFDIEDGLCLTAEEEGSLLVGADLVIAIQEAEAEELRRLAPGKTVITVGIDFDPVGPSLASSPNPVILLVASGNPQNEKGLRDFLRFAWPIIRREVPEAKFRVVGSVGALLEADDPAIKVMGLVDNLSAAYAESRVVINPAVAGTGLKIKTIEALCHLRPLVTWPSGVDGVDPEMQALCHVATDWYSFTRLVIDLCRDGNAIGSMVNAVADIQSRFSADAIYATLGAKLEILMAGRS